MYLLFFSAPFFIVFCTGSFILCHFPSLLLNTSLYRHPLICSATCVLILFNTVSFCICSYFYSVKFNSSSSYCILFLILSVPLTFLFFPISCPLFSFSFLTLHTHHSPIHSVTHANLCLSLLDVQVFCGSVAPVWLAWDSIIEGSASVISFTSRYMDGKSQNPQPRLVMFQSGCCVSYFSERDMR